MKVFRLSVLSLVLTVSGGILALAAQNRTVSGKVLDAQQQPIVGVAVLVDGTTRGTTTSENGSFTLDIPAGEVVLNATYLGYIPQKVTVPSSKSEVTIYLQEDAIQLEEAVVIGYGTQKRVNLTGAVSTVSSKELENRLSHSVTNMLQGSVAGLNITTSSGKPGTSGSINIRGVNSINSADPLVVIDGVAGDSGDLNRLNPADIESISVIKDASAAAVYGARAAFGVIMVTTKSGSANDGKATVRYSGRFGWEEPTTSTDYENRGYWSVYTVNKFWQADSGSNYIKYNDHDMQQLLARVNDKTEHPDRPWVVEEVRDGRRQWVYCGNYDWWDMLFRQKRPVQQHNISISGGTKDIKYLVSGKYDRQEGMQRAFPDVFNRYNLRSKIDFRINKWATLSNNSSFFSSKYTSLGDGSIDNTLAYSSRHALACFPMQNPDGSWLYATPYIDYKVGNGRHIMLNEGTHRNVDRTSDASIRHATRAALRRCGTANTPIRSWNRITRERAKTSWTKTSRPVISTRPTSMPATTRPSATHTICRPRPVSTTSSSYGKRYRHGGATSRRSIWTTSTSSARTKTVRRRPVSAEVRPNTVCWDSSAVSTTTTRDAIFSR